MNGGQSQGAPSWGAIAWFCLLLLVCSGLQVTVGGLLPRAWGEPDLPLTLMLVAALLSDAGTGACVGLGAGLITAGLIGQTVGTYLVSRTIAGFVAGGATARLYRGNVLVVFPGVLLTSLLAEGIYLLAAPRIGLGHGLRAALLGSVGNAVLSLPLLFLLRRCGWGTKL